MPNNEAIVYVQFITHDNNYHLGQKVKISGESFIITGIEKRSDWRPRGSGLFFVTAYHDGCANFEVETE